MSSLSGQASIRNERSRPAGSRSVVKRADQVSFTVSMQVRVRGRCVRGMRIPRRLCLRQAYIRSHIGRVGISVGGSWGLRAPD